MLLKEFVIGLDKVAVFAGEFATFEEAVLVFAEVVVEASEACLGSASVREF